MSLHQLRRDPHILGWMARLRSRVPPLAPVTYISRIIFLRGILAELAWSAQLPELAGCSADRMFSVLLAACPAH